MRDPGVGVGRHLLHVGRKAAGNDVGQGDLLENGSEAGPHGHPHLLEVLGRTAIGGHLRPVTADLGQWSVQGPDDVGDSDLVGTASQAIAALGAPLAGHDAGSAQIGQDRTEESGRKALLSGQVLRRLGRARGRQGQ